MDNNSWRIKFDSTLPSSMTSMASSSASPERRNQMEMNSGQYFHQYATQDSSSALHERRHDSLPPNYSNLNSHKSNHSEMENSFLALLSGLPSLLQCDFRELSSQKVSNAARSVNINDFESEIPRTSGALLSENLSNKNTQNEANCSFVPYRLVSSSSSSSVSVLHGSLHASNINLQTLGLAKVVNHHMLPSIEKVKDFATLKGDCCGTSSGKAGIPYRKDIQLSLKIPEESNSSISNQSLPILSRCPHMFCLGTGRYVLLSNTGLLGIVCSCHYFHTSVSKFCKIRVPEDQSGWDWPEGLLPATGLVKSIATVPKISNTSCLVNPIGSS